MTCGVLSRQPPLRQDCYPELERRTSRMLLHDSRPGQRTFSAVWAVECSLLRVSIATDTVQTVARDKSRPRLLSL
jgi:hypothetical protein